MAAPVLPLARAVAVPDRLAVPAAHRLVELSVALAARLCQHYRWRELVRGGGDTRVRQRHVAVNRFTSHLSRRTCNKLQTPSEALYRYYAIEYQTQPIERSSGTQGSRPCVCYGPGLRLCHYGSSLRAARGEGDRSSSSNIAAWFFQKSRSDYALRLSSVSARKSCRAARSPLEDSSVASANVTVRLATRAEVRTSCRT